MSPPCTNTASTSATSSSRWSISTARTFRTLISRGPLPTERATAIAAELCRFLEDADRFEANIGDRKLRSLLHGDLKPRNVRITGDGQIKVLDFGIAKALSLSRKVTRNDFGSVAYLSPERLETRRRR